MHKIRLFISYLDYCPPESTRLPSPDGNTNLDLVVKWPETLLGRSVSLSCPCGFQITSTALIARRNCSGNFVTGAVWDSPNTVPCQFSITARRLCKLSEVSITCLLRYMIHEKCGQSALSKKLAL